IKKYTVLEGAAGFHSELFGIARTLVRAAEELPKKSSERLREFRDSNLDSLKLELFSEEPIYPGFETVKLADGLSFLCAILGYDDPMTQQVLAGKSPVARAEELIQKTELRDVSKRKHYWDGGKTAVESSKDPLIRLALLVDPESRALRKIQEVDIEEVKRQ